LGHFAFHVFLFCHPFGGRDSLKKAEIPEGHVFPKGTFSGLAKSMRLHGGDFRLNNAFVRKIRRKVSVLLWCQPEISKTRLEKRFRIYNSVVFSEFVELI